MFKQYSLLFFVLFLFQFSKSDNVCVLNISTIATDYSNYLCGYGQLPSCNSIQDALSSLSNLVNTQSCSVATLNLSSGTFMGEIENYLLFGNYDQLKLNNVKTIILNGQSNGPKTIIDGTGENKKAFFGLSGTSQSLQFEFNSITFQNWVGDINLFDIEIQGQNQNALNLYFRNTSFTNIQTISIANIIGSSTNYNVQFENVNFNDIFTISYPIISSNSTITMINSTANNIDEMTQFINLSFGTLKLYKSSFNVDLIFGKNSTVIFIETQYEVTSLCHCENCIYQTSNQDSLNPTSLEIIDAKCPHKTFRFWAILISSIGAAFIIVCIIVIFILNKKFGIIDIANKKRKSRKSKKYYGDEDEQSFFLNDSDL